MRIEMALPALVLGGMERMVIDLALGLAERGHDVGITCLNDRGVLADELTGTAVRFDMVPAPGVLSNVYAPALVRHFRAVRPDVVHTHSGVWGRAARAARLAGVPRVLHTVHGRLDRDPWYDVPLKRWEASHTDSVIAVSDALGEDLVRRLGIAPSRVSVLLNGIPTRRFSPDPVERQRARAELSLGDAPAVGIIARLAPVKNHGGLIAAFAEVRRTITDAVLLVIGDGPLERALQEQAASLLPAEAVRFLGVRTDTPAMYRALDLFVLPSHAEGTSMSILEAMASGTPVVASPVGGSPLLLDDGRCGLLTRGTDPRSLADAMIAVLVGPDEARTRADAALQRVRSHFSLDAMLDRYEELYAPAVRTARRA